MMILQILKQDNSDINVSLSAVAVSYSYTQFSVSLFYKFYKEVKR